jgi:hypothetical protein
MRSDFAEGIVAFESETSLLQYLAPRSSPAALLKVLECCVDIADKTVEETRRAVFAEPRAGFPVLDEGASFDLREGILVHLNGSDARLGTVEQSCTDAIGCCLVLHYYAQHAVEDAFRSTVLAMLARFAGHIGSRAVCETVRFVAWLRQHDIQERPHFAYALALTCLMGMMLSDAAGSAREEVLRLKAHLPKPIQACEFDEIVSDPEHGRRWRQAWVDTVAQPPGVCESLRSLEKVLNS